MNRRAWMPLSRRALFTIAILAIFYTVRTTADMFAGGGYALTVMSPWMILTAFASYGTWQLFRIPR